MNFIFLPGDEVFPRLRAMAKKIGCSVSEALGIVTEIWMFAGRNADEQGYIEIDMDGVWYAVASNVSETIDRESLVIALQECEIVEQVENRVCIVGWEEAQRPAKAIQKDEVRKMKDRDRKRMAATERKKAPAPDPEPEPDPVPAAPDPPEEKAEETPAPEKKPKKQKPPKTKYAEFVHMYPEEYEKLAAQYGQKATEAIIRFLDNYKGSKGKAYKDD